MTDKKSETIPPSETVQESQATRYQYFEAYTDILRLKLHVKECENIPSSTMMYSVNIALPDKTRVIEENIEKNTSWIMALEKPKWNETLSFFVKETDLKKKENFKLDIKLYSSDEKHQDVQVSIQNLMNTESIAFPNDDIKLHITGKLDTKRDVKFRNINKLCRKENVFRTKRQEVVFENMKKELKVKNLLQVEAAPKIAILGSGGGMRAVIGMCGAMNAMQNKGILDSTMYTAGVSGSAWYLLTLYAHGKQLNPNEVSNTIRKKLNPLNTMRAWEIIRNLHCYIANKVFNRFIPMNHYSMTDTFGEMIGDWLLEEKCKQKWSDQREKLADGLSPLPLVAALHVRNEKSIKEYNEWIEFSPYEVFMPRYGAAIDMKHFGSRFYGGFITKQYAEQPIHFLQGMCGSGYAVVRDYRPTDEDKNNSSIIKDWRSSINMIKMTTKSAFNYFDTIFVGKVPNWLRGIPMFRPLFRDLDHTSQVDDFTKADMMLVDAGLAFNSPYPAVLHPARKIDVILSFDFSDRRRDQARPFRELEKAKKWADDRNVRFPDLNLDEIDTVKEKKGHYEEVYVFEGDEETPTIIHFVMINQSCRSRCPKDADGSVDFENFYIHPNYPVTKFGYDPKDFEALKSLVEYNVYNNMDKIIGCIQKVIDRKQINSYSPNTMYIHRFDNLFHASFKIDFKIPFLKTSFGFHFEKQNEEFEVKDCE